MIVILIITIITIKDIRIMSGNTDATEKKKSPADF